MMKIVSFPSFLLFGWIVFSASLPVQTATAQCNAPNQPGSISGSTLTTPGTTLTYSIVNVPSAQSYVWSVPTGWNITQGQGTTNIQVVTGTASGSVAVIASRNGCDSPVRSKTVNVNLPASYNLTPAQNIDAYGSGFVIGTVSDPNGAVVSASLRGGTLPNGSVLNTSTGAITVTSTANLLPGTYSFQIRTTDAVGGQTNHSLSLTILPDREALIMVYPVKHFSLYTAGDSLISFMDFDGPIVSAQIVSGTLPTGTRFDAASGLITVDDPAQLSEGDFTFEVLTTDATGGRSIMPVTFIFRPANPLPVVLVSFEAQRDGKLVKLNWLTTEESQNDKFQVERSADGATFEAVGDVKGQGNTHNTSRYEFTDRQPLFGTTYYRLKQIDTNGQFAYSPVRSVKAIEQTELEIYPNPAESTVSVNVPKGVSSKAVLWLVGANGQVMKNWKAQESNSTKELDLAGLAPGVYFLMLSDGATLQTQRLVKQ